MWKHVNSLCARPHAVLSVVQHIQAKCVWHNWTLINLSRSTSEQSLAQVKLAFLDAVAAAQAGRKPLAVSSKQLSRAAESAEHGTGAVSGGFCSWRAKYAAAIKRPGGTSPPTCLLKSIQPCSLAQPGMRRGPQVANSMCMQYHVCMVSKTSL